MKMTRRVLALLLALCLTFGNVMPAMATGLEGEETVVTEETTVVVPEVEETEAPADAEEPAAPVADETEAPAEAEETETPVVETEAPVEETEAPVEETVAQIVDEATNEVVQDGLLAQFTFPEGTTSAWVDGNAMNSGTEYTANGYTLTFTDCAKVYAGGNDPYNQGFIKFGTSSVVGSLTFTVPSDVNSVVLHLAKYKANTSKYSINGGTGVALTKNGNDGQWDEVTVDTSTNKTVTVATVSSGGRMVMYSVLFYSTNVSGSTTPDVPENNDPAADSVLTVAQAIELGASKNSDDYTDNKYYVTGEITEVYNTTYGNMKITDGNGNILTIYGTYSADGKNRYDAMEVKPVAGDTVTVYGIIGQYNGTAQIKNGWITEHVPATGGDPEPSEPENNDPAADSTLSIADAIALGASKDHDVYTEGKYYVTGEIVEVYQTKYGNMRIKDEAGNILTVYGTYSADGETRYDALEVKPVAGDTVTVYGIIGQYNGTAQIKNGWITEHVPATGGDPEPSDPTEPTDPEPVVSEAEIALAAALAAGGTVTLTEDINLVNTLVVPEGITVTLDMAGHSITGVAALNEAAGLEMGPAPLIQNNGILTITGNGTFTNTTANCVSTAADTVLTIEDGSFNVLGLGSHCVAMGDRSTLNVQGGTFTPVADSSFSHAIWAGVEDVTITITGGTFASSCLDVGDGVEAGACGEVVTITGGTFADDVTMYVADGYEQMANGTVVKMYEADSVLTIAEAIALGKVHAHNTYTEGKYYVTGEIVEVYQTKYGNMRIKDEAGNILTVYGTYSADGETRYDALEVKPVAGDTVTVYGIIGQFNGTPQLKNGWITEHVPAPLNFAFDNSGTGWDKVDAYVAPESGDGYRIDLVKTEGDVYYFSPDEYFPLTVGEIKSIGFCEYSGGGYTDIIAYENGKTYSASDFTITDDFITIYWDNSVAQYEEMDVEYSCQHGGYEGPMVGHFGGWSFAKSIEGDIYTFELPACVADCVIWIGGRIGEEYQEVEYVAVDGMTYPQCIGRPGAESNPMMVTFEMNEDYTEGTATVTIPANKTYYFQAYGVGGMELSVNGGEPTLLAGNPRVPSNFTVTNDTAEEAVYTLTVTYPAGSQMNPETLYLGSQYTSLAEGNNQGYYYTYIAEGDAVLEFSFAEGVAEGTADIAVTNMNTYAQKSVMWDAVDGVATIEVSAGDELMITVVALPDANWNYPAMDLQWNFNYPAGTEQNPEMVQFSMNEMYTEGYATVTVPANATYYFQAYGIGGMELFVNEEFYMLLPSVMGRQPVSFSLTNETEEAVSYDLRVAYPAGHQMNPAELMVYTEGESWDVSEGRNVAEVAEGSWNGYLYSWTAPKAGELTINVSNGKAGWAYSITNMNTYEQTDLHCSYDMPNVNAETITVSAGDEIQVMVNTAGASFSDVTPAGKVYFDAIFVPVVGTEENPIQIEWNWNETWSEATATVTVPANTSIFASFTNGGMMLTINDGEPVEITGNGWMPQVLEFKGAEEGETVYNLKMFSPVGSFDNPAELVIGENSCEIAENSNGYIYKWTADSDGELTITMGADVESWSYCVNNLTTWVYGDTYSSTDEEIVSSYTVAVAAGDEIQITINTPFSYDTWSSPAGTVTFTADFAIPEGAEGNPIFVQFEMDESYMYGNAFVTVPAYTTYYFQSYGIGGMTLEIATEQAENEGWWIVDRFTLPNVMGRQPVVFSVTNDTAEDKEYGLSVSWAIGSQMNPENVTWWYGSTGVELAEGDTDGYYFTHTAPITGPVEFFLNQAFSFETGEDVAADIIVTNMNTYEQKVLSVDGVDGMMYMDVTEGDELQIIVTAQPDENWNYPAAYIYWGYGYIEGTEGNPTRMELGKNSVKIEANDEDGYYFIGFMEEPGYVTITMNSSNWEYKVGQCMDIFDEEGYWIGEEFVWSDLQASNVKGAKKSQTICLDSGNYYLYVNTANKKAGTVNFTVTFASTQVDMVAGKTATLKFIDPATGKAIAASNANWSIGFMLDAEGKEIPAEEYANYLTIPSAGKLTAAAGIEEEIYAYVFADLKDGNEANGYVVYIRPAVTSIQINKGHLEEVYVEEYWNEEYGYWEGGYWTDQYVVDEENVTEVTFVVNGENVERPEGRDFFTTMIDPEAALQEVVWTSSNPKIAGVATDTRWTEDGQQQVAYLYPHYDSKTGKVGTGTVTLTATANDGSGVKATVVVDVVLETKELYVYAKNYQWMVGPGKSVNMIAEAYTWYNQAPTNKNVIWDMEIVSVFDYETYEWVPYVPAEGEAPIATISDKGVVKAASSVDKPYELKITATAEDTGVSGDYTIYVAPLAKTGEIMNVPETYDISSGEAVQPWANFYDVNGKETMSGYTWSSSNKNVAEFVTVEEYDAEYDAWFTYQELRFTGKTGKVTLTATATDGSRVKATATINVTKAPNVIEMIEEASVAAGKTLTLKATPAFESYDWENDTPITDYAVSDKNVLWDAKVVEWNEDKWEWVEVEQDIGLKISNGKLSTNAKKITGTEPITVKVTATAKLGVYDPMFEEMNYASATCIVTVYPATKQVDLVKSGEIVSKKTLTVEESNYIVLDAVGAPVGEYIWKSSNEKVAVIENNPDGSVTVRSAGKMGKATITATANDGTKKSAKVTVNFVKAVEEIYFPEDLFLSVAKGKSVNFSKTVVVGPTDASNKKLTWSMEWVEPVADEEGYIVDYVTKDDGIVPKTVATMSNGTVKAVMKNVTDFEYVRITATAADKYGATCEAIVVLAPNAIKGLQLHLVNEDGLPSAENYAKKKYTTTDSQVVLMPVATNGPDDLVASGLTFTSSNKNFEVVWGDMGIVVRPVKDAVNPYGTVKVTLKATDGSNANTNITIIFAEPEAE